MLVQVVWGRNSSASGSSESSFVMDEPPTSVGQDGGTWIADGCGSQLVAGSSIESRLEAESQLDVCEWQMWSRVHRFVMDQFMM